MNREVRCQAVILKENKILVLRQFNYKLGEEYWMLPGGGLEANETPEEGIIREIKEETNLDIDIQRILFDEEGNGKDVYKRYITFLCVPKVNSIEQIGYEEDSNRKILELVWMSIIDENNWNDYVKTEQFYPSMKRIKNRLLELKVDVV